MCGGDLRSSFAHNVTFFCDGIEVDLKLQLVQGTETCTKSEQLPFH